MFRLRAAVRVMALVLFFVAGIGLPVFFLTGVIAYAAAGRWAGVPSRLIGLAAALWVIGPAVLAGWRPPGAADGHLVERSGHPRLWDRLDQATATIGMRRVDEVWLIRGSGVVARADGGLLGLRTGPLRVHIGLADLLALGEDELIAVVARELARHSRRNGILAAVATRGADAARDVSGRVRGLPYAGYLLVWRRFYRWCAGGAERTVVRTAREQAAARLWGEFTEQYWEPARAAGLSVALAEGFRCLLAGRCEAPRTPAASLLDSPALAELDERPPSTGWPEALAIIAAAQAASDASWAAETTERLGLTDELTGYEVLLLLEAGILGQEGPELFELASVRQPVPPTARLVHAVFASAALSTGRARFTGSWSGPPTLCLDGKPCDLEPAIDRAIADPDAVPALRQRVTELGIPLEYRPAPPPRAGELAAAVLSPVKVDGRRAELAVFPWGLLVLPQPWRWRPGWMVDSWLEQNRIARLAALPAAGLLETAGARTIPTGSIVAVRLPRLPPGTLRLTLDDGARLKIRLTPGIPSERTNALLALLMPAAAAE